METYARMILSGAHGQSSLTPGTEGRERGEEKNTERKIFLRGMLRSNAGFSIGRNSMINQETNEATQNMGCGSRFGLRNLKFMADGRQELRNMELLAKGWGTGAREERTGLMQFY